MCEWCNIIEIRIYLIYIYETFGWQRQNGEKRFYALLRVRSKVQADCMWDEEILFSVQQRPNDRLGLGHIKWRWRAAYVWISLARDSRQRCTVGDNMWSPISSSSSSLTLPSLSLWIIPIRIDRFVHRKSFSDLTSAHRLSCPSASRQSVKHFQSATPTISLLHFFFLLSICLILFSASINFDTQCVLTSLFMLKFALHNKSLENLWM